MQDIQVKNNQLNVTLRKSLLSLFQERLRREMENLSCHYFSHNLIKNYYKPDHMVSSFHSHPEWQEEYWQDHWNSDVLSRKVHQIAETDGFAISSWDFIDAESDVMKRRKQVCDLYDGVQFTFKHEDGLLENYSFGWKKSGRGQMGFDKLLKLSEVVSDFRDEHLKLFSKPTPNLSDGR
jgi:hypothetical protein